MLIFAEIDGAAKAAMPIAQVSYRKEEALGVILGCENAIESAAWSVTTAPIRTGICNLVPYQDPLSTREHNRDELVEVNAEWASNSSDPECIFSPPKTRTVCEFRDTPFIVDASSGGEAKVPPGSHADTFGGSRSGNLPKAPVRKAMPTQPRSQGHARAQLAELPLMLQGHEASMVSHDDFEFKIDARLAARMGEEELGELEFRQTLTGLEVRLGSVLALLKDRFAAAEYEYLASSSGANTYLPLSAFGKAGVPLAYDPQYDHFRFSSSSRKLVASSLPLGERKLSFPAADRGPTPGHSDFTEDPNANVDTCRACTSEKTKVREAKTGQIVARNIAGASQAGAADRTATSAHIDGSSAGAKSQTPRSSNRNLINLPVQLSGQYIGDAAVAISEDQTAIFMIAEDIDRLLRPRIAENVVERLIAAADQDLFVSQEAFEASGLKLEFDPATLEVTVELPLDLSRTNIIEVAPQELASSRSDFIEPEALAGALILSIEQSIDYARHEGVFEPIAAAADLSLALGGRKGVYVFSQLRYDGTRESAFTRGQTLLVHDDTDRILRYSFGDLLPDVRGFQTAPQIGGIGIQRSYDILQPNRNVRPAGQFRFQLDEPSLVEITVNGAPARVLRLDRGQYDLRDFNFITGANQVEVFVIDDFGRRSVGVFDQFFDFNLLEKGLDEFGIFMGPRQTNGEDGLSYDFDDIAITAFYRRGLSSTLTAGMDLQAESGRVMMGGSATAALPVGSVTLASALSHAEGFGDGVRVLASFEKFADRIGFLESPNINFEAEYISPRFTTIGATLVRNDIEFDLRARVSGSIQGAIGVGLAATYSRRRDGLSDVYNSSANVGTNVGPFDVNLRAEHSRFADGRSENRVLLSVGLRLGQRSTARTSYDSRGNRAQLEYARFRNQVLDDFGIRANLTREDDRTSGLAELSYNHNRALVAARQEAVGDGDLGNVRHRTSLSASTQISFAGNQVALARPVGPRFVLIHPHETLDSNVQIRRGVNVEQLESTSGALGPGLGSAGDAYTQRQVTVRAPDAPAGYDVGNTVFTLSPPPVAGYVIQVGSEASYSVSGILLDADGEPIRLLAGELLSLDKPDGPPVRFFTNRVGRFVAFGLLPGRHRLKMGSGRLTGFIEVTRSKSGTMNLGNVVVQETALDD